MRLLVILLIIGVISTVQAAGIKKWVDDQGVVHYGTSIPPQYVDREHAELNERGIEVERFERAKTPEELAQQRELERLRMEQQRLEQAQRAQDQVLLKMFRTEDDLIMVRDGKLEQISAQIRFKQKQIERFKERLSTLLKNAQSAEHRGTTLNKKQQQNLQILKEQIAAGYTYILDKEKERRQIATQYNQDLHRFRELQVRHPERISRRNNHLDIPEVDGAFICADAAECNQLWSSAIDYAKQHANTPVALNGERIFMTRRANHNGDVSVTLSYLSSRGLERLFLDVQCPDTLAGRSHCASPDVKQIQRQFNIHLQNL